MKTQAPKSSLEPNNIEEQFQQALHKWSRPMLRRRAYEELQALAPLHTGAKNIISYLRLRGYSKYNLGIDEQEKTLIEIASFDPSDLESKVIESKRSHSLWYIIIAMTLWFILAMPLVVNDENLELYWWVCPGGAILILVTMMAIIPYLSHRVIATQSGISTQKRLSKNTHISWQDITTLQVHETNRFAAKSAPNAKTIDYIAHSNFESIKFNNIEIALHAMLLAEPEIIETRENPIRMFSRFVFMLLAISGIAILFMMDTSWHILGVVFIVPFLVVLMNLLVTTFANGNPLLSRLENSLGGIFLLIVGAGLPIFAVTYIFNNPEELLDWKELLIFPLLSIGFLRMGYVLLRNSKNLETELEEIDDSFSILLDD